MDERFNTADDTSTSDKNLVNFSRVTPEFCRRVCTGRAIGGTATDVVIYLPFLE